MGPLVKAAQLAPYAWALSGALVLGAVLAFTHLDSISVVPLALGAVLVVAILVVYARRPGASLPRVPRPWGVAIDAAVIAVLLLAILNLEIFTSNPTLGVPINTVIAFHHDLWLGPVNEMLSGRALLVDTAGQYGIGPLYLLGGWFQLAPIGYGTLGFFDGALFALLFASGYCVLRMAGTSRLLAAGTLVFAVIVLVYNLAFSVGGLPQHGPLRFGLPMALILAAIAEARWPRHALAARSAQLVVVGLASIWALEAFAYTAFTYAAILCFQGLDAPGARPGRVAGAASGSGRWRVRRRTGRLHRGNAGVRRPAARLRLVLRVPPCVLRGNLAEITYDFSPWSAGWRWVWRTPRRPPVSSSWFVAARHRRPRADCPGRHLRHHRLRNRAVQLLRRPIAGPRPAICLAPRGARGGALAEPVAAARRVGARCVQLAGWRSRCRSRRCWSRWRGRRLVPGLSSPPSLMSFPGGELAPRGAPPPLAPAAARSRGARGRAAARQVHAG